MNAGIRRVAGVSYSSLAGQYLSLMPTLGQAHGHVATQLFITTHFIRWIIVADD
jgi:hypothetical protein